MILFAWRRLPPPGFIGGAEISEGLVARALAAAGQHVTFLGSTTNPRDLSESWLGWLLTLLDHHHIDHEILDDHIVYRWRGVECHAVPQDKLLATARRLARSAQLIWTSQEDSPTIRAAAPHLPAASYAHSVSAVGLLSARLGADWVFAPSCFVQQVIGQRFGVTAHLLRPPVEPPRGAEVSAGGRSCVLLVNPIRDKGVQLALDVARRLPSTRFVFVEAWRPADTDLRLPPNVRVMPRQPTLEPIYRRTRLLMVPSLIEDACPRVILEAAAHAIPTVGSDLGGIPELIADPHNVLPSDDVDGWAERCDHLLRSPPAWRQASHQQRLHAAAMAQDPIETLRAAGFPVPLVDVAR